MKNQRARSTAASRTSSYVLSANTSVLLSPCFVGATHQTQSLDAMAGSVAQRKSPGSACSLNRSRPGQSFTKTFFSILSSRLPCSEHLCSYCYLYSFLTASLRRGVRVMVYSLLLENLKRFSLVGCWLELADGKRN